MVLAIIKAFPILVHPKKQLFVIKLVLENPVFIMIFRKQKLITTLIEVVS